MPRSYAPQFRAMVVEQVRSGRAVAEVAADLELSQSTVFRWVRQDWIDRGELAGTPSAESAELRTAKRRIAELEAELATVKAASELFDKGRVGDSQAVGGRGGGAQTGSLAALRRHSQALIPPQTAAPSCG